MRLLTRTTATGLIALGLSVGIGTAAFAVDEPGPVTPAPSEALPPKSQGRCIGAINRRVIDLATWSAKINVRDNLTPTEKADLVAIMTATSNGLLTVAKPAVLAATTKAQLKTACQAVVTDYRVYLVVYPKVFITAAAESWVHRINELQAKAAALQAAGKDVTAINALLNAALALAQPIPGLLAPITPASYNANPGATTALFNSAKGNLNTVRLDVRAAAKLIAKLSKKSH